MRRFEAYLASVALVVCFVGQTAAAPIAFYKEGTSVGTFLISSNQTRATLFQALNNVTLTQVGALIDPSTPLAQFRWQIFNSADDFTFGTVISDQTVFFTDVGLATYDTEVNAHLTAGNYYILWLQAVDNSAMMSRFNEEDQGLPFTTTDGNFIVRDGASQNGPANTILPSFSVAASVPEPSAMFLLVAGLAGFAFMRRRKRTSGLARVF